MVMFGAAKVGVIRARRKSGVRKVRVKKMRASLNIG